MKTLVLNQAEKSPESKPVSKPDSSASTGTTRFSDILSDPAVRERWEKVRRYFFLRESTYDMTSRCNIRCDGCYFYEGEKQYAENNSDPDAWRRHMTAEKERGITYAVLAGAEPSLVPELCQVCSDVIPLGAIATNGVQPIPTSVGYKIHISVWGNDQTSRRVRHAADLLKKQMENYRDDPRAIIVYTFTRENIDESREVIRTLVKNNFKVTFNVFSAPVGYQGHLRHTPDSLAHMRSTMSALINDYPRHIIYSPYNTVAHTHTLGLHSLYGCSYPRRNPSKTIGLGRSFRQYRSDLTWDRQAACCVPDTDCDDCRHYAAGSAVVTARLFRHAASSATFKAWLDYVDTYLAVWVADYSKGTNLCHHLVPPPGRNPA